MEKPVCGSVTTVIEKDDAVGDVFDAITALLGVTLLINLVNALGATEALTFDAFVEKVLSFGASPFWIGVLVAVVIVAIFFINWWDKCMKTRGGDERCLAGAVDSISDHDPGIFPFAADHPHIDVAVRPTESFWMLLQMKATRIHCNNKKTPLLRAVFKSDRVCGAALGAVIGAVAGGVAGVLVGAATAAAWACAFPLSCLLALIVVILIVAAIAIAGAWAGSAAGNILASQPGDDVSRMVSLGDLVRVEGPTAANNNFGGAVVQAFVNEDKLAMLGTMGAEVSPFHWDDVEAAFFGVDDGCPELP